MICKKLRRSSGWVQGHVTRMWCGKVWRKAGMLIAGTGGSTSQLPLQVSGSEDRNAELEEEQVEEEEKVYSAKDNVTGPNHKSLTGRFMDYFRSIFVASAEYEGCRLTITPNESPVYGGGLVVIGFAEESPPLLNHVDYFVIFEGISWRHVTTARVLDAHSIQSIIPSHKEEEDVRVSVLQYQRDNQRVLATSSFYFRHDSAHHVACWMIDTSVSQSGFDEFSSIRERYIDLFVDSHQALDGKLTRAFAQLDLPKNWNLLGQDSSKKQDPTARETLLHLAARMGLEQLTQYLMTQSGSHEALHVPDPSGRYPMDIARENQFDNLAQMLKEYSHGSYAFDPSWSTGGQGHSATGLVTRNEYGMATVTNNLTETERSLEEDLEILMQFSREMSRSGSSSETSGIPASAGKPNFGAPYWSRRGRSASDTKLHEDDSDDSDDDSVSGDGNHPAGHRYRRHANRTRHHRSSHYRHHYQRASRNRSKSSPQTLEDMPEVQPGEVMDPGSPSAGIPTICVSPPIKKANVLEENLRRLHDISDGIQRLRDINTGHLDTQDERKENLQRFSTSCPSLAADQVFPQSSISVNREPGLFKSMLDITNECDASGLEGSSPNMPGMDTELQDGGSSRTMEVDVRICINDVTVDSTDDFTEGDELSIEQLKKQRRRSSWCPEEGRQKEDRRDRQRMLAVTGRSQSLSSLDGQDEDSDEDDVDSDASSYSDQKDHGTTSPSRGSVNASPEAMRKSKKLYPTAKEYADTISAAVSSAAEQGKVSSLGGAPRRQGSGKSLGGHSVASGRSLSDVQLPTNIPSSPETEVTDGSGGMSPFGLDGGSGLSGNTLAVPAHSSNLMKSVSTPAIPSINEEQRRGGEQRRSGTISEGVSESSHTQTGKLSGDDDQDDDEILNAFLQQEKSNQTRLSMIEFLNDPSNFEDDEGRPKQVKEEKKRRHSVFSKLGSYRQKKLVKDNKLKSTHQFVSVSFSNSTACDVCNKSMANKDALQCENCLVNVHENSCKDQIAQCTKFKHPKLQHRDSMKEKMTRFQSSSLPEGGSSVSVKSSQSFKERRAASVPTRSVQLSQSTSALPKQSSPGSGVNGSAVGTSGYFQWRRVATKLGIDKVISEERENNRDMGKDATDALLQACIPHDGTNITDTMSVSMESLDEGTAEVNDFEDDPDLIIRGQEAEAWSVTVDKKTLKKMSAKDIKRQDHIWELIQTEKSHCRTLKIMQKIFSYGMQHELHMSQDMVDRIFPKLDDLIDIHLTFLHTLTDRQKLSPDRRIDDVGDILVQQFEGKMGNRMKLAYGDFCSQHNEAVQLYKDILKSDRKFQNFIKKCSRNLCKRLGIPECILLVTQRMTKYPLLIEPIIKTTKENRPDRDALTRSLGLAREILNFVDERVDAHEKEQRLIEVYNRLDARSSAMFKGKKFKKSDLLSNNRKLLYEGTIKWMSARGKAFEVIAVILSDLIFFLSDTNQKYAFFSQDNKSSVVSLSKLLVREKGDTRDSKGIYLICQSKTEPEMYELVCRSTDERRLWIQTIRNAIAKCPEEDEGVPSESEEERKLQEARSAKLRELIDHLHQKDSVIKTSAEDKSKIVADMLEIYAGEDAVAKLQSVYKDDEGQEIIDTEELLQLALQEASRLTLLIQSGGINLSRSVSSVGEHESSTYHAPPLPKRAETFSGFEAKEKLSDDLDLDEPDTAVGKKRFPSSPREMSVTDLHSESLHSTGNHSPVLGQGHRDKDKESDSETSLLSAESGSIRMLSVRRGSIGVPSMHENSRAPNNKDRMNRRMSTSFLQHLLTKQHNDKDDGDGRTSEKSSDRGSLGELSSASSSNPLPLIPPTKDQCASVVQLVHYINAFGIVVAQQSTEVESFRAKLAESNSKVNRLYAESERLAHDRKNVYHHDKQLEELRNLQESINRERAQWEKLKEKQEGELDQQRQMLLGDTGDLNKARDEIRAQRDELQRQRDALQRQIDLHEQQARRQQQFEQNLQQQHQQILQQQQILQHQHVQHQQMALQQQHHEQHNRTGSPDITHGAHQPGHRPVPPSVVPQSLWDNIVHKRSASDDIQQRHQQGSPFEPMKQEHSNSLKEPLNSKEQKGRSHSGSSLSGSNISGGRRENLPIHLMSATNQQKIGQVTQQLPFKLASSGSSASSSSVSRTSSSRSVQQQRTSPGSGVAMATNPAGAHSMQSGDHGMSLHSQGHASFGHSQPPPVQSASSSSARFTLAHSNSSPAQEVGLGSPKAPPRTSGARTPPAGHVSHGRPTGNMPRIQQSRSQPTLSGVRSLGQSQSILPMKLAEGKRSRSTATSPHSSRQSSQTPPPPGSNKSPTSGHPQDVNPSSQHSQKSSRKEPEIIYF